MNSLGFNFIEVTHQSWSPTVGDLWLVDDRSPRNRLLRLLILAIDKGAVITVTESGAEMQFKSIGTFSNYIRSNDGILLARNVKLKISSLD